MNKIFIRTLKLDNHEFIGTKNMFNIFFILRL
jgi:hypothetical protein